MFAIQTNIEKFCKKNHRFWSELLLFSHSKSQCFRIVHSNYYTLCISGIRVNFCWTLPLTQQLYRVHSNCYTQCTLYRISTNRYNISDVHVYSQKFGVKIRISILILFFFFIFIHQYSNFTNDYKLKRFVSARRTERFHRDYALDL